LQQRQEDILLIAQSFLVTLEREIQSCAKLMTLSSPIVESAGKIAIPQLCTRKL
jgi:transcriptional regulator with PAS, ATPase and Fis domain